MFRGLGQTRFGFLCLSCNSFHRERESEENRRPRGRAKNLRYRIGHPLPGNDDGSDACLAPRGGKQTSWLWLSNHPLLLLLLSIYAKGAEKATPAGPPPPPGNVICFVIICQINVCNVEESEHAKSWNALTFFPLLSMRFLPTTIENTNSLSHTNKQHTLTLSHPTKRAFAKIWFD